MTEGTSKNNTVLVVIAVIGALGTIFAATIAAISTYNVEKLRQESELTKVAIAAIATQGGATQAALEGVVYGPSNTPYPSPNPSMDGMTRIYIPAGKFDMGRSDGEADNQPIHTIYLDAYFIDETEVTNAMFRQFTQNTGYVTDAEKRGWSWVWFVGNKWEKVNSANWRTPEGSKSNINGLDEYPVIQVSWNDANAYCAWAGRRLPTEAEWEKAAIGTDNRMYPWGNVFNGTYLNFCDLNCQADWKSVSADDGYQGPAPVGSYVNGASPYGVLDMAGNVWEWVNDYYNPTYYQNSLSINPKGPENGENRVLRGGSFLIDSVHLRPAYRIKDATSDSNINFGFRCAGNASP